MKELPNRKSPRCTDRRWKVIDTYFDEDASCLLCGDKVVYSYSAHLEIYHSFEKFMAFDMDGWHDAILASSEPLIVLDKVRARHLTTS